MSRAVLFVRGKKVEGLPMGREAIGIDYLQDQPEHGCSLPSMGGYSNMEGLDVDARYKIRW